MLKISVNDAWIAPLKVFENVCSKIFEMTLQDVYNMPRTFYFVIQPSKKELYSCYRNQSQIENVDHELSLLII